MSSFYTADSKLLAFFFQQNISRLGFISTKRSNESVNEKLHYTNDAFSTLQSFVQVTALDKMEYMMIIRDNFC